MSRIATLIETIKTIVTANGDRASLGLIVLGIAMCVQSVTECESQVRQAEYEYKAAVEGAETESPDVDIREESEMPRLEEEILLDAD